MLYTILPEEMIFPNEQSKEQESIEIDGGFLIVEKTHETEYKVVRLVSSNPSHYLNENYAPGRLIQLKPQF